MHWYWIIAGIVAAIFVVISILIQLVMFKEEEYVDENQFMFFMLMTIVLPAILGALFPIVLLGVIALGLYWYFFDREVFKKIAKDWNS